MRNLGLALSVLALGAAPAGASTPVEAGTRECDAERRTATFEGEIRSRPDTHRMQIRPVLQALLDGRWSRVRAPGFGTWVTSEPGIGRLVVVRTVQNLPAPGAYRARMAFRRLSADGTVLDRRVRRTPVCRLPDPRPDLMPVAVVARPGGWAVAIRNTGRSRAPASRVAATVDGVEVEPRDVEPLGPGEEALVAFEGPCATSVRVEADASGAVDERDEDDNVLEAACPRPN